MKKKARFFATTVLTAAVVVGGLALFGALVGGAAKIADSSKASAAIAPGDGAAPTTAAEPPKAAEPPDATPAAAAPTPDPAPAPAFGAPAFSAPAITVEPVTAVRLRDEVRASGLVAAVEEVMIQPQIEGQAIDRINVDVGDHVTAGQVLVILSESALTLQRSQLIASRAAAQATIAQSQALLTEARAAADTADKARARAVQLQGQGNISQAAYDQAVSAATSADARVLVASQTTLASEAQLALVNAQIQNVELQLSRTQIRAPVAGQIIAKNATAGAIATAAGPPLFVLFRDGLLELEAGVAEQDLPRLTAGLPVTMRAAGSSATLSGKVRLVEPAIDPVTRLGQARIIIDQADMVRSGTFLEAVIHISERTVPSIPISALGTDVSGNYVITVGADGRVRKVPVEIGVRDGGRIEIRSGVTDGTLVVAKAASFVRDGDLVTPVRADPAQDGG